MRVSMRAGETLLIVLWVGSLWAVGYLAAPVLFAELPDRALAGQVAGRLFAIEAWLSLACSVLLILFAFLRQGRPAIRSPAVLLPAAMMAAIAAGEWLLGPRMSAAREAGEDVLFGRLHGAAALLYLLACVVGLALALRLRRPAT